MLLTICMMTVLMHDSVSASNVRLNRTQVQIVRGDGYGQILKISDDGIEKHIVVKPKDPVFGITINFLETGNPQFLIPAVSIDETAIILKNLEAAKAFCMEFYNKRDELIQDAI